MAGMARLDVIGNIGRDCEIRYSQTGTPMASFSIAHSPRARQGQEERTNWYRCTLMGPRAESLKQYLVKGKQVFVRGDFDAREYEKDGQTRTSLDIFVTEIELLGSRQDGAQQGSQGKQAGNDWFTESDESTAPF